MNKWKRNLSQSSSAVQMFLSYLFGIPTFSPPLLLFHLISSISHNPFATRQEVCAGLL